MKTKNNDIFRPETHELSSTAFIASRQKGNGARGVASWVSTLGGCINSFINMKDPKKGACAIVDTGVRHIVRHIDFPEFLLCTLLSCSPAYFPVVSNMDLFKINVTMSTKIIDYPK